jgi:hypothetical protein
MKLCGTHVTRGRVAALGSALAVVALIGVANLEVTTKQGLNFEVSTHRLPLYLKALQFIDRSAQYHQISQEITRDVASDAERALKIFDWTRQRIRTTPPGWPIVDDHILHIIIRGHGVNDQQADVFATLATYAGVPAFWARVPPDRTRPAVTLSFARVDGLWRVFDVFNGVVFRSASGELATMDDIGGHPELVPASAGSIEITNAGTVASYKAIVTNASMPAVPSPLRAELQMPAARLWHQLRVAVHLESE